jgi:hypothetical protein
VSVEEGSLGLYLCNGGTLERKRRKGIFGGGHFSIFASSVKEGDGVRGGGGGYILSSSHGLV